MQPRELFPPDCGVAMPEVWGLVHREFFEPLSVFVACWCVPVLGWGVGAGEIEGEMEGITSCRTENGGLKGEVLTESGRHVRQTRAWEAGPSRACRLIGVRDDGAACCRASGRAAVWGPCRCAAGQGLTCRHRRDSSSFRMRCSAAPGRGRRRMASCCISCASACRAGCRGRRRRRLLSGNGRDASPGAVPAPVPPYLFAVWKRRIRCRKLRRRSPAPRGSPFRGPPPPLPANRPAARQTGRPTSGPWALAPRRGRASCPARRGFSTCPRTPNRRAGGTALPPPAGTRKIADAPSMSGAGTRKTADAPSMSGAGPTMIGDAPSMSGSDMSMIGDGTRPASGHAPCRREARPGPPTKTPGTGSPGSTAAAKATRRH